MSLVSKLLDPLATYARSWGVDPLAFRSPSKREVGLAAVLSAAPLLAACPDPSGNGGVNPPPPPPPVGIVSVNLDEGARIDSGILEVPYSTEQDFERCRLRLHGVTVAVDENVPAGDHVISFARVQPNTAYPVDVLCSDENGMTHERGQITDDFAFSMQDFRSNTVNVETGSLEQCVFTPVQDYASSKGNLPVSAFAPLDSGCYWNPDEDSGRESEFVLPEEAEMIDWLSSDAKSEGMSDHTITTLLSRVAGPEELLSRDLVWWDLSPRIWEDEINFAQRGWNLYQQNVSRGWQDGSFDLDYRILGLMNEFWPEDYNLPGTLSVPSETGIPQNPGSVALSFLNLADDYLNDSQTWLGLLGFTDACQENSEMKPIFGHDQVINRNFALDDQTYVDGIPVTWWLPTEGLVSRLSSQAVPGFEQNDDLIVTVDITDHSRDLYKGAPAILRAVNAHLVSQDTNGDGAFELSETDFSAGMILVGYSGDRDGGSMLYTNASHLRELDYNIIGPHLGRLEARKWSYAGAVSLDDADSPGYTWGMQQDQFGMVDSEMIDRGFGFVGLGKVDSKYARVAGVSGSGLLVDVSVYGFESPSGNTCAPYELVFVEPK